MEGLVTTPSMVRGAVLGVVALSALAVMALHGREPAGFFGSRFEGPTPSLVLPDDHGGTFDLARRHDGITLVTFGYRHCPDVCPTILADLHTVLDRLGRQADRVRVVFVTLDPARDTAATLQDYLASFAPRDGHAFLGLVGDDAATAGTARRWGVTVRPAEGRRYFDHTALVIAIDRHGRARLRYGVGQIDDAPRVASDIKTLLHDG